MLGVGVYTIPDNWAKAITVKYVFKASLDSAWTIIVKVTVVGTPFAQMSSNKFENLILDLKIQWETVENLQAFDTGSFVSFIKHRICIFMTLGAKGTQDGLDSL